MVDKENYIGKSKLKEEPSKPLKFKLKNGCIKTEHIDDAAVTTEKLNNKAVTPSKVSDDFQQTVVSPLTQGLDDKYSTITDNLNQKFTNITNELYDAMDSLQVGGIALSGQFGNRTDIGIHQKALTKAIGAIWDELGRITGKTYMDFTLTVTPSTVITEGEVPVTITADCSDAISDFDSIRVYKDGVLIAESSDQQVFTVSTTISDTSQISAFGTIMGKTLVERETVTKLYPFFMGGAMSYQDIMTEEYQKQLDGTLEGDYDLVVKQNGQHMFIIIPESHKAEFRRVNMMTPDMSGFEIPLDLIFENEDYVVYKSKAPNGYLAGTYNVDININS